MASGDELDEFYQRLWTVCTQDLDSILESAWQELDAGGTDPGWSAAAQSSPGSRATLAAVWHAIEALGQTVVHDVRYWLAYQAYRWAILQLNELEPLTSEGQTARFDEDADVVIVEPPYTVVDESSAQATQATGQLSFW